MALFRLFLLVVWFASLETLHLPNTSQSLPRRADYMKAFNQTVHAMDNLMSFYEEEVNEVNLDAIYGLRVLEGALAVSLTQHGDSFWKTTLTTKHIHKKLSQLRSQAASINNRAQGSIKEQGKEYYFKFRDVVDKPWSFFTDFGVRTLPMSRVKALIVGEGNKTWDEATSDRCMSEAIGSNANHTECMFTPVCIETITDQRQVGYGSTHQILFLTVAIMHKCVAKYSKILKDHLGIDVDDLIENRCVRIMDEMLGLEKKNVPEEARDLYMEQAFVCSIHGYEEFLSLKRLMDVLSWQRTPGCFGNDKNHEGENEDELAQRGTFGDEEDAGQKRSLGVKVKDDVQDEGTHKIHKGQRARRNLGPFVSMRRLLVDVTVGHGCSAHESGVAAGLLGLYTKWLLTKVDTESEAPIKSSNLTGVDENTKETNNYNPVSTKNISNDHDKDNSINNYDKKKSSDNRNSNNEHKNSNDNKKNNNNKKNNKNNDHNNDSDNNKSKNNENNDHNNNQNKNNDKNNDNSNNNNNKSKNNDQNNNHGNKNKNNDKNNDNSNNNNNNKSKNNDQNNNHNNQNKNNDKNNDNSNNNNNKSKNNDQNNNHDNKNKNNDVNNNNNDNVASKDIYIRSMVISFVTSLLVVTVILSLYKFGGSLCICRISSRKYRPLVDA